MKAMFLSMISFALMCSSAYAINFTSNAPMTTTKIELVKAQALDEVGNVRDTYGLDSQNKKRLLIREAYTGLGTLLIYALYDQEGVLTYSSQALEIERNDFYRIKNSLNLLSHGCKVILSINDKKLDIEEVRTNCKL